MPLEGVEVALPEASAQSRILFRLRLRFPGPSKTFADTRTNRSRLLLFCITIHSHSLGRTGKSRWLCGFPSRAVLGKCWRCLAHSYLDFRALRTVLRPKLRSCALHTTHAQSFDTNKLTFLVCLTLHSQSWHAVSFERGLHPPCSIKAKLDTLFDQLNAPLGVCLRHFAAGSRLVLDRAIPEELHMPSNSGRKRQKQRFTSSLAAPEQPMRQCTCPIHPCDTHCCEQPFLCHCSINISFSSRLFWSLTSRKELIHFAVTLKTLQRWLLELHIQWRDAKSKLRLVLETIQGTARLLQPRSRSQSVESRSFVAISMRPGNFSGRIWAEIR